MMVSKTRALGILVCVAAAVAVYSLFMPFVTYYFGSWTGRELLQMAQEEADRASEMILMIIYYGAISTLALSVLCMICDGGYVLTMLASIGCAGAALYAFCEIMDYAENGFWMYLISHAVSAVLSGICLSVPQNLQADLTLSVRTAQTTGLMENRKFCPECGKQLAAGGKFCPGCGTAQTVASEKQDPES